MLYIQAAGANHGYDIPLATPEAEAALADLYAAGRLSDLLEFTAGAGNWRLFPNEEFGPPPEPTVNGLYWPMHGAQRFARGHFLLDYYSLGKLRADLGPSRKVTLTYKDRGPDPTATTTSTLPPEVGRSVTLYLLDARPVSRTNDGPPPAADPMRAVDPVTNREAPKPDDLWLVTLVDKRYLWNHVLGAPAPDSATTWTAFLQSFSALLPDCGPITVDALPAAYQKPSSRWLDPRVGTMRAALMLDAAAHAVGGRVVVSPTDGVVRVQRPNEFLRCKALAVHSALRAGGTPLPCTVSDGSDGGATTTTAAPGRLGCSTTTTTAAPTTTTAAPGTTTTTTRDPRHIAGGHSGNEEDKALAPAAVRVVFASAANGDALVARTVTLADADLPSYANVDPIPGTAAVEWCDVTDPAWYAEAAKEQARSHYLWRLAPVDAVYGGFPAVPANGYFDHVHYLHGAESGVTRVFRGIVNRRLDLVEPKKGLGTGDGTGPVAGTAPACCNDCRWDWSVGLQEYVLGSSPCDTAAGCRCSAPRDCPPDKTVSSCAYTPCGTLKANAAPPVCKTTTTAAPGSTTTTSSTTAPTPPPGCGGTFRPTTTTTTKRPCRTDPCTWYCHPLGAIELLNPETACAGESGCGADPQCPGCPGPPPGFCLTAADWCHTTVTQCGKCPPPLPCPTWWACVGWCAWVWVTGDTTHNPPDYWAYDARNSNPCRIAKSPCGTDPNDPPCTRCLCDPPSFSGSYCGQPYVTSCYCHDDPSTTTTTADPCSYPTTTTTRRPTTTSTIGPCDGYCAYKSNSDATAWVLAKTTCTNCDCAAPPGLPASNCALVFTGCVTSPTTTTATPTTTTTGTGTTTTTTSTCPPAFCLECTDSKGNKCRSCAGAVGTVPPNCVVVGGPYSCGPGGTPGTCPPGSCGNEYGCYTNGFSYACSSCGPPGGGGWWWQVASYPDAATCAALCKKPQQFYCWDCSGVGGSDATCAPENPGPGGECLLIGGPYTADTGCVNCNPTGGGTTTTTAAPTTTTTTTAAPTTTTTTTTAAPTGSYGCYNCVSGPSSYIGCFTIGSQPAGCTLISGPSPNCNAC